ncbi:acyl-CoA thioesterase [Paraburkholderia aspalathi]|nr:acyl-CoA thioesterase [Paraburkholderia aspalathi]
MSEANMVTMRTETYSISSYPWRTNHDVRFSDVDVNGHVNNGAFNALMESSRGILFCSEEIATAAPYKFVLARFEIDFLASLSFPGNVEAGIGVLRMGNSSLLLKQALFNGAVCAAEAYATIVAVDPDTLRACDMGEGLRREFKHWLMGADRAESKVSETL